MTQLSNNATSRHKGTLIIDTNKSHRLVILQSPIHGLGCFAAVRLLKGSRITEYIGEKITRKEAIRRMNRPEGKRISELAANLYIDASVDGNETRYINHSCAPNADALVAGRSMFIFALRDIAIGEEITVDYLNSFEQDHSLCQCLTPSCREKNL
jgi:SET domain-containing protein